jgi:GNAT superfamily N-acetyltransferase
MLKIRPFEKTAEEYNWVVGLVNAVWPDHPTTEKEWKHFQDTVPADTLFREIVVEVDGQSVAHAFYCKPWWWGKKPGHFFFEMHIHPDHQASGVGKAIYEFILADLACESPNKLLTKSREDQADYLHLMDTLGFEQTMRYPASRLDVAKFDLSKHQGLMDKVTLDGIRIQSLSELQKSDPNWKQKFYELRWAIAQDVPSPEPREKQPFESFEKMFLKNPDLLPEANFFALDGDDYVGFSNLWPVPGLNKLDTGLTGIVRSHRRKGIATALKLAGFEYARASGIGTIETENEEDNPMYQLNLQLGFSPCPAWLDFRKLLDVPSNNSQAVSPTEERIA